MTFTDIMSMQHTVDGVLSRATLAAVVAAAKTERARMERRANIVTRLLNDYVSCFAEAERTIARVIYTS